MTHSRQYAAPRRAAGGRTLLLAAAVAVGICWVVCHVWGVRVCRPMLAWLERGGEPDHAQRVHTVRLPLLEARNTLTVWAAAGVVYGVLDVAVGGSPAAGVLIAVLIALSIVQLLLFLVAEQRAEEPILPLSLFRNRIFTVCAAVGTPASSISRLANSFDPSICAAAPLGPKAAMPASSSIRLTKWKSVSAYWTR